MKKLFAITSVFIVTFFLYIKGYSQTTQFSEFEPSVFEGSTVVDKVYSPALEGNLLDDLNIRSGSRDCQFIINVD